MKETLAEAEAQLDEFRHDGNRQAWLAQRLRQRCLKNDDGSPGPAPRLRVEPEPGVQPEVLGIEASILAEHFHGLPEPGRSALALFYLDLFTPEEVAQLLKMNIEQLGATLAEARTRLQESLDGAKPPPA
jgi:DNA-directed RNA polymerase specialized sigma24 family protein